MSDFIVAFVIPLAYIALAIAAVGAVVFPLIQMVQDLKKAKSAFIGVGIIVVVFLICYFASDGTEFSIGSAHVSGGNMQMIEASLYTFYVLLVGSVVAILYSTVSRYFK